MEPGPARQANLEAKLQRRALKKEKRVQKAASRAHKFAGMVGRLDAPAEEDGVDEQFVKGGLKHGWYVPNINTYPTDQSVFETDLASLIRNHVLPGHVPPTAILAHDTSVVTLGSCFARELRRVLSQSGVNATRFWVPSGLNNTFALLDFFSWCVHGQETGRGFRYQRSASGDIEEWTPEAEREAYRAELAKAGAFVFTIGLAEVWQDRETGGVFWRGVPKELFEADRHVFRLTTVEENANNLRQIVALIREVSPHAAIVLTLSPVPLLATYREISCLTADCVSKSVLRVAIDQVMHDALPGVYYFPSFEVVKWVGAHLPFAAYGDGEKSRDVNRQVVGHIIDAFIDAYYTPESAAAIRAQSDHGLAPVDADGE